MPKSEASEGVGGARVDVQKSSFCQGSAEERWELAWLR